MQTHFIVIIEFYQLRLKKWKTITKNEPLSTNSWSLCLFQTRDNHKITLKH